MLGNALSATEAMLFSPWWSNFWSGRNQAGEVYWTYMLYLQAQSNSEQVIWTCWNV